MMLRSSPNLDVLKEPRGFIKILEIFIAIFAFSCLSGFRGEIEIDQTITLAHNSSKAPSVHTHIAKAVFEYPFESSVINTAYNETAKTLNKIFYHDVALDVSEEHNSQLFMVIAVFCFLYVLGMLVYYVLFEEDKTTATPAQPASLTSPPVIDFLVAAFWTFFWFVSACALAASLHSIKGAVNPDELSKTLADCIAANIQCTTVKAAKFSTLTVAILMGFLNCFVWAGNMWFLWKETPWHRDAHGAAATVDNSPQQQLPAAAI